MPIGHFLLQTQCRPGMTKTASRSSVSSLSQQGLPSPTSAADERPVLPGEAGGSPQPPVRRDSQGMAKRRYSLQPQRAVVH